MGHMFLLFVLAYLYLVFWLFDFFCRLVACKFVCLFFVGWLRVGLFVSFFAGCFICFVGWLRVGLFVCFFAGRFIDQLVTCMFVCLFVCLLVGWLVGVFVLLVGCV